MGITMILSFIMMAGLFLMLFAGVALIKDKRYFTSAPKDVQEAIQPREERFSGQHLLGWLMMAVAVLLMVGTLFYAGWNGVQMNFSYGELWGRYAVMLLLLKAFDILFFDWFLLCHSDFYPHFYPEVKELVGPHQFGFNKKAHIVQIILCPLAAASCAAICQIFA